jgi:thymidylate synthase (FAD)|tara:strand:- start:2402 stop:3337 length:936 start_codon:yes stop_codon:yes gene_type:complete
MPRVERDKIEIEAMHSERKYHQELKPVTIVNQLDAIDVTITDAPSPEQFRKIFAVFLLNTCRDTIITDHKKFSDQEIDICIDQCFRGELLPTAMETVSIAWTVSGLDMIDTTHLIRHRAFSFSAQLHGDRDVRRDRVVAKPGILCNPALRERYETLCNDALQLYVDSLDSGELNLFDARTVLPRCFEHFYMVRSPLKDLMGYCRARADEQLQPISDNLVALKLWLEVLKIYPWLKPYVDFRRPDAYYQTMSKKGKTSLYPPNDKNEGFDWHEDMFLHPIHRDEFPGGEKYLEMREEIMAQIDNIKPDHHRE